MTQTFEMADMADLFEQYRELSRMLVAEAQAIREDRSSGPRDRAEGVRLEQRATQLNRLMADYYQRDRLS